MILQPRLHAATIARADRASPAIFPSETPGRVAPYRGDRATTCRPQPSATAADERETRYPKVVIDFRAQRQPLKQSQVLLPASM